MKEIGKKLDNNIENIDYMRNNVTTISLQLNMLLDYLHTVKQETLKDKYDYDDLEKKTEITELF